MGSCQSTKQFQKTDLAYKFLINKEKRNEPFSAQELAESVGWAKKTAETYLSKKWRVYITKRDNKFFVESLKHLTLEDFREIHSHAIDDLEAFPEAKALLHKSREAALLAVYIYNNPYTTFKAHGFIVNIIIAYTALFHAIFEKNGVNYLYKDNEGNYITIDDEYKAFELIKCSKQYWQDRKSAIKANLEFLIGLRNKIEHRSLPAIDLYVEGECQAAMTNYENILAKEFGKKHSLNISLSVSMQLTAVSNSYRTKALKELQTKNYKVIKKYIDKYRIGLDDDISQS